MLCRHLGTMLQGFHNPIPNARADIRGPVSAILSARTPAAVRKPPADGLCEEHSLASPPPDLQPLPRRL